MGELLFKVSGISGKLATDEEELVVDAPASDSSRKALTDALGADRRDRILSALYLTRQDTVISVRTASINIWKFLVQNTPRTGKIPQLTYFQSPILSQFASCCLSFFLSSSFLFPAKSPSNKK